MPAIYSIGHSTRTLDEFLGLLSEFDIELLADVRRFPGSRKWPQFNKDQLEKTLPEHGIAYAHFEHLGGRRRPVHADSPNGGLRHPSFRSYADYMATPEFVEALNELMTQAGQRRTALMCAEAVYWRCHRRLISDYLFATRGIVVQHILGPGQCRPHRLTDTAKISDSGVTYPPALWTA